MNHTDHLKLSRFDTSHLAPGERFEAWRRCVDVIFGVSMHTGAKHEGFQARLDSFLLRDIVICRSWLGSQSYERAARRLAKDGIDHYLLHVYLRGTVDMSIGRRRIQARPGHFVNLDLADPFFSETSEYEMLSAFIPRRRLAPLLRRPDSSHGQSFSATTGTGRLLADYMVAIEHARRELHRQHAQVAADALTALAAMAMNGTCFDPLDPPACIDEVLRFRVRGTIQRFACDSDFDPKQLAARLGISRAKLYRLWREKGGIAAWIRRYRLRRAFTELTARDENEYSISEIAYKCGYKTPEHFSRQFKAKFGVRPGELKKIMSESTVSRRPQCPTLDTNFSAWVANIA